MSLQGYIHSQDDPKSLKGILSIIGDTKTALCPHLWVQYNKILAIAENLC